MTMLIINLMLFVGIAAAGVLIGTAVGWAIMQVVEVMMWIFTLAI